MALHNIKTKKTTLFTHLILFDFFFVDSLVKQNLSHFGTFPISGKKKKKFIF